LAVAVGTTITDRRPAQIGQAGWNGNSTKVSTRSQRVALSGGFAGCKSKVWLPTHDSE